MSNDEIVSRTRLLDSEIKVSCLVLLVILSLCFVLDSLCWLGLGIVLVLCIKEHTLGRAFLMRILFC